MQTKTQKFVFVDLETTQKEPMNSYLESTREKNCLMHKVIKHLLCLMYYEYFKDDSRRKLYIS